MGPAAAAEAVDFDETSRTSLSPVNVRSAMPGLRHQEGKVRARCALDPGPDGVGWATEFGAVRQDILYADSDEEFRVYRFYAEVLDTTWLGRRGRWLSRSPPVRCGGRDSDVRACGVVGHEC